jgi:hypothetical protein
VADAEVGGAVRAVLERNMATALSRVELDLSLSLANQRGRRRPAISATFKLWLRDPNSSRQPRSLSRAGGSAALPSRNGDGPAAIASGMEKQSIACRPSWMRSRATYDPVGKRRTNSCTSTYRKSIDRHRVAKHNRSSQYRTSILMERGVPAPTDVQGLVSATTQLNQDIKGEGAG